VGFITFLVAPIWKGIAQLIPAKVRARVRVRVRPHP